MPTYSYTCDACKRDFEHEQRISEPALKKCPLCGKAKARRMISSGNFILKGGGWYSDGYGSGSVGRKTSSDTGLSKESSTPTKESSTTSTSTPSSAPSKAGESTKPAPAKSSPTTSE